MENVQELVIQYLPLANKLACQKKKHLPKFVDLEDLKSAAYLGLVEAANRFDPKFGVKFSTFAYTRIFGAIYDYLRSQYRINHNQTVISIDAPKYHDGGCLADSLVAKPDSKSEEIFEFVTYNMSAQAKKIIRYYFIDGYSMKEIGQELQLSESRICQLIKNYKFSMKDKLLSASDERLAA